MKGDRMGRGRVCLAGVSRGENTENKADIIFIFQG